MAKHNRLKTKLGEGRTALGAWCALSDSLATEIITNAGPDYVTIDMQHGVVPYSSLIPMLQAVASGDATPLVRIPHRDFAMAQRALDAGAEGLIIPMVSSVEEAQEAAAACRYPPEGSRSFGPIRARMHLGADTARVNRQVLCLVQVETTGAIDNLEDILQTPGIDGVYVGPADLALSHGLELGQDSPELVELLTLVVDACKRQERIAGIHAISGVDARRALERGFVMVTVGSDAVWLRAGYERELAIARGQRAVSEEGIY